MFFDEGGQLVGTGAYLSRLRTDGARAQLKGRSRRGYSSIHVDGAGFRHLSDWGTASRIGSRKRFSGFAVDPSIVNQEFGRANPDLR